MEQYQYIHHVLGSYFSISAEQSDGDALEALQKDMQTSRELAIGLRSELRQAFSDPSYPWRAEFAQHGVIDMDDDAEAKAYAHNLLGTLLD